MFKQGGFRPFLTGMTPTLAREVPGYFFFFGAYEMCRKYLMRNETNKEDVGFVNTWISGSVGGTALWTAIFPADVVKSRMQVQGHGTFASVFMDVVRTQGKLFFFCILCLEYLFHCILHVKVMYCYYNLSLGISGLYAGLAPTVLRTCTASGGLFIAYEYTKKFLHSL